MELEIIPIENASILLALFLVLLQECTVLDWRFRSPLLPSCRHLHSCLNCSGIKLYSMHSNPINPVQFFFFFSLLFVSELIVRFPLITSRFAVLGGLREIFQELPPFPLFNIFSFFSENQNTNTFGFAAETLSSLRFYASFSFLVFTQTLRYTPNTLQFHLLLGSVFHYSFLSISTVLFTLFSFLKNIFNDFSSDFFNLFIPNQTLCLPFLF